MRVGSMGQPWRAGERNRCHSDSFGCNVRGGRMLLEDLLVAVAFGVALVIVGVPIVRVLKVTRWRRADPLAEARERLRVAKLEAEAARVHREADKIYEELYGEALGDDHGGEGAPVGPEAEPAEAPDESTERGKGNGRS